MSEGGLNPLLRRSMMIVALVFVLDQATKHFVLYGLDFISQPEGYRIAVMPFFDLAMVWNRGISYGLLQAGSAFERWLLVIVSASLIAVLVWWLLTIKERLLAIAIAMMIGGALGNLVDRVLYGAVADFFLLHAFSFEWYVFNIADSAIVLGVALMAYDVLFLNRPAKDTG